MNQRIQLSDHFTTSRILRFAASPIIMMVFTSIYLSLIHISEPTRP